MPATDKALVFLSALSLSASGLSAQREEAVFKSRAGSVKIDYGVVTVGKHGLHELEVGSSWRMGHGTPTTLFTHLPVIAGDRIVPPGSHALEIHRRGAAELRLSIGGRDGVMAESHLTEMRKPNKKLHLDWIDAAEMTGAGKPAPAATPTTGAGGGEGKDDAAADADGGDHEAGTVAAALRIDFSGHRVEVPVRFVAAEKGRARRHQTLGFTYPVALFQQHLDKGLVVLTLVPSGKPGRGEFPGHNVVVSEDGARIVAFADPPKPRRRGGEQEKPAEPEEHAGSIEWTAVQDGKAPDEKARTVTIREIDVDKDTLEFQIHTGDRIGKVKVPMPGPAKKK